MSKVAFTFDGSVLWLVVGGEARSITKGHPNFRAVKAALKNGTEEDVKDLLDESTPVRALNAYFAPLQGKVELCDGQVYYNGEALFNNLTKRIVEYVNEDLPHEPLLKFLENVMENPSYNSRKELFDFLEYEHLPITEDGCFLGYKAIRADFTDKRTGRFNNNIGMKVSMPREKVDDNTNNGCSAGLHVGTLEYARGFAGGDDILVLVKVNPRDAVSVPRDCTCQKLRTCAYTVVAKYEAALDAHLYDADMRPVRTAEVNMSDLDRDEWDEDYEEEDEDFDDDDGLDYFDDDDITSEEDDEEEIVIRKVVKAKVNPTFHNVRAANGRFKKKPRK